MQKIVSISPLDERVLARIPITPNSKVKKAVADARKAQQKWAEVPIEKRVKIVRQLKPIIKKRISKIAQTVHLEMGKPYWDAEREVESVLESIEFHCSNDPKYLKPITLDKTKTETSLQLFEPIGVVAVITPWNFPFSIPFDAIPPALIVGDAIVFKTSELTTFTGIEISKVFRELERKGLPKNVFNFVVGGKATGKFLVKQDVDMISFVGSRRAGIEIMRDSSKKLHRLILELGGKDPAIVCRDAGLEKASKGIVYGAYRNCGQVCCAVERVYVEAPVYEEFATLVLEKAKEMKVGSSKEADIGPLAAGFQRRHVQVQIDDAVKKGAKVLLGGKAIPGKGFWFEPTVLVNVNHKMNVMKEETFGPVIPIMKVKNIEEALRLANDSVYGLTASIWTENRAFAKKLARRLVAGTVTINRRGGLKEGCPWGGAKQSGIGRQSGRDSVRSYTEIKHLWVK
ncbi:MAG: aldehyde dehydrogenase family protein [Candidatus Diapherotrites archaeon]|nr:aldehyde dehydrogenase family protein [Candidatus Diapherotrites archaeon]